MYIVSGREEIHGARKPKVCEVEEFACILAFGTFQARSRITQFFIFLSFGWVLQISQSYTSPITEEPTNSITRRPNSPLIWLYLETSLVPVFAPIHPPIHRMYSLYCDRWNKRDDTEDFRHGRRSCRSVVEVMRRVDRYSVRR